MALMKRAAKALSTITLASAMFALPSHYALAELPGMIKIGMTSALTGPYNEFGEGNRRGVELAVERWNAKGGINGHKIEITLLLDDQLNPDRAVQNMRRILDNKEIVGIIGPAGSGPSLAVIDMVQADGRPYINAIPQTPTVTYPDSVTKPPRPNVFSFALQNNIEASVMAQYLTKHVKRIGVIHESTAYGVSGLDYLNEYLAKNGANTVVATDSYNQGTQDMTAQVARLAKANVEAIAAIGLGKDLAVLRRTMARMNVKVPLIASNGALGQPFQEGAGELVLGTRGTMIGAFAKRPLREATKTFADAYKAKFGVDRWWGNDPQYPQLFTAISVANAYDGANVLFEGIRRANSTDPQAIIKAIESITNFDGVNAVYSFSKSRHHALDIDGVQIFEYVKEGDKTRLQPVSN